jgi:aspartate/methionine/tyrosine aminotransferase
MNNNNYTDIEQQIADAIDTAEEICSPLDDIIERSIGDPGAPFDPEVIRALARLRGTDFRAYETVRAKLKSVGCRVTELDKATTKGGGGRMRPRSNSS